MANSGAETQLAEAVVALRSRISKYRGNRGFNEQNTKASLIVPILQALGWDTNDPDEVHWEYKPKPKYNPVDFALLLQRTPCLLLEAKALRESLADDKLVAQILTYAAVAGVQWVALTNGDEYRIYNASAALPIEEKLFRKVSLSVEEPVAVASTLALLSKQNLQDKKIGRMWESHFVDRQVKLAVEDLLNPEEPARVMVRAIKKLADGRLRESDVRSSLRRVRLQLDFPEVPESAVRIASRPTPRASKRKSAGAAPRRAASAQAKSGIQLADLIREGVLQVPAQLSARFRGHDLTATVDREGKITVGGDSYDSLSKAAGMARKPYYKGSLKWGPCPPTNGWAFWSVRDSESRETVPIDVLRDRYLQRQKSEADRFRKTQEER